jgi:pimeloyl-ACP methyl ester carboxylesterase
MRSRTRTWRPELEERARAGMREEDGELVPHVPHAVLAAGFHGVAADRPSATLPAVGAGDHPVLLVAARGTLAQEWAQAALDRFRDVVPRADVETVEAGHDVLADAPEETIGLVAEWLRGRLPSRPA